MMAARSMQQVFNSPGIEKHFSPQEVAVLWGMSVRSVIRMFETEPGVIRISMPRRLGSSQSMRATLRIPASVVNRMHEYLSSGLIYEQVPLKAEPKKAEPTKASKRGRKPKPSLAAAPPASKEPASADSESEDAT
jgi:hypothetical protein